MSVANTLFVACLACGVLLTVAGVVAVWMLDHAAKKVVGVAVALLGASIVLGFLGAPDGAIVASAAVVFGYVAVGVALQIRLQEHYGAVATATLDAADEQGDAQERST